MTDRIKQTGFASFKAEGVKPLPTEPVQVYEDSPFWNKVRDMADQEDRIKRMAEEAGFHVDEDGSINDGVETAADFSDELAKFAALVAEDERRKWVEIVTAMHKADEAYGCGFDNEDWLRHYRTLADMAGRPKPD